jgi:hypothetical protein
MASKLAIVVAFISSLVLADREACYKPPYEELLFLSNYPVADAFCSVFYPPETVTIVPRAFDAVYGRQTMNTIKARQGTTTRPTTTVPTATTPSTTNTKSIWESCSKRGGNFLSTLCSCIETTMTVTCVSH